MNDPILLTLMRYLHITGAILTLGGLAFSLWCLMPSLKLLDDPTRNTIQKAIHQRFQNLLLIGIAMLTVSGTFNWIANAETYRAIGPQANILLGIKTLLAMAIFGIVIVRRWRQLPPSRRWGSFNLHLGAVVVLLASTLLILKIRHFKGL